MSVHSLLYISRSLLAPSDTDRILPEIVSAAIERNTRDGITGALICTGPYFAQVIEGERRVLDALMVRLRRDVRHTDLKVIDEGVLELRRFGDWSMAYLGPSQFVAKHVTRLLNDPPVLERRRAADWLAELLGEFSGCS